MGFNVGGLFDISPYEMIVGDKVFVGEAHVVWSARDSVLTVEVSIGNDKYTDAVEMGTRGGNVAELLDRIFEVIVKKRPDLFTTVARRGDG